MSDTYYGVDGWRQAVAQGNTRLGLDEWLAAQDAMIADDEAELEPLTEWSFTISATFAAFDRQGAWDMWADWLDNPLNVEDGTQVVEAQARPWATEGIQEAEGTEGQDRESYTDTQDRESYTVDERTTGWDVTLTPTANATIFGQEVDWSETNEGHLTIYSMAPNIIPAEQVARVIYELRLDVTRLNDEAISYMQKLQKVRSFVEAQQAS
jgi:hypothetical protein